MGRFLFGLLVVVVVVVILAVVGGSLPAGNPLHDATEGLRSVGRTLSNGFGGGYRPITP